MPYNENTNWDNEEKYLNNLVSQGGGNAAWAQNQLKELNNARAQYGGGQSGGGVSGGGASGGYSQKDVDNYWKNDKTDYDSRMTGAQSNAEFGTWAQYRQHQANAQGRDISGYAGAPNNAQLYEQWRNNNYNAAERNGYISNGQNYQGYYGMDSEGHWGYYDDSALTKKSANGTWDQYASSDGGYVRVDNRGVPDMTVRDMSRAGQTVYIKTPQGQYKVEYNNNGYPVQATKDGLGYNQMYSGPMYTAKTDNDQGVTSREMLYDQYGATYIGQGGLSRDRVNADENERRMHVTGYQQGTRDQYERILAERGNREGIGPVAGMERQITNPGGYAPNPGRGVTSPQGGIDFDNEERYLNGLIAQGGGNAEWAKKQLAELNEARKVMQERANPGSVANPTSVGNNSYLQMIDGTKYLYANDPNAIGAGNVYQGGLGSGGTGREVMQARTPDGQIINVEYINGVRQTDIPDGTIVHTAGGDYVYHAQSSSSSSSSSGSGGGGGYGGGSGPANDYVGPLNNRAPDLQPTLDSWLAAARAEAELKADYAVSRGVNELTRAEQDAQQQFQTQRNQVDAAAARATDNQALYNERRGDRGGIGAAQYDAIANTAAQNQLTINQAQTKLSTDTARQIADLRAQGEFQKADSLLQLSQTYLSQLIDIQQWAAQFNLSVDEFNKEIEKWNLNYEMDVAQLLGNYRGQRTLAGQSLDLQAQAQAFDQSYREASLTGYYNGSPTMAMQAQLAEAGVALAQMGIMPSQSQMAAMQSLFGYDQSAVQGLVQTALLAQQAKLSSGSKSSGGGGGRKSSGGGGKSSGGGADNFEALYLAAYAQGNNAKAYISNHYKEFGFSSSTGLWDGYQAWADEYDPGAAGAGTIDSASQLGAKAKSLYNSISGIRNAQHLQTFGARVQAALAAGEITDAEADFLLRSVNY